jgi:hypothetical protein
MLVTPLPGIDRRQLRDVLRDLYLKAQSARSGNDPNRDYFGWTDVAVVKLTPLVSAADVERLVQTTRYWTLISSPSLGTPQINSLIIRELDQRVADLDAAHNAVETQINKWARRGGFVVPDTTFFVHNPETFDKADYFELLGTTWRDPLHLIVPIIVIDELDSLKQSKGDARHRARLTLAILDRIFHGSPQEPHELRPPELRSINGLSVPTGELTIEILFDPPGHARLPINDDEIIDRALAVEPLAGRNVTLLTYDTSQSFRARSVGLHETKLKQKEDDSAAAARAS